MNYNSDIWVEKYRPQIIADCILPEQTSKLFKEIISTNNLVNLVLTGTPGIGKTTVARALCRELDYDHLFINGSENGNIDTLRTTIRSFASSVSLNGSIKVVILDEGDYLNPSSFQPALRSFIEEFSSNCRFIITCNYKNKIIEPLLSRLNEINFKIKSSEKPVIANKFLERVKFILNSEQVKYEDKVLAQIILNYFPDFRKIINTIQRYVISTNGILDKGILANISNNHEITSLLDSMRKKNFAEIRKWISANSDIDSSMFFRMFYDGLYTNLQEKYIPQCIVIIADYQYKSAFVADQEINNLACIAEIMLQCEFK